MIIYNTEVQLLEDTPQTIDFIISDTENPFHIDVNTVSQENPLVVGEYPLDDQVLLRKGFDEFDLIIYTKSERILVTRVNHAPKEKFSLSNASYKMNFETLVDYIAFKQTSETSVSLFNSAGEHLFSIHDVVSQDLSEYIYPLNLDLKTVEYRFLLLGKIHYGKYNLFFVYDLFKKEIVTKKVLFTMISNDAQLDYKLIGPDLLEISDETDSAEIEFKKVTAKGKKLFDFYQLPEHRDTHMLGTVEINEIKYFVHNKTNGVFMTRANAIKVSGFIPDMKLRFFGKNLYIFGRNTHYAYKASGKYDYLYIEGNETPISKFVRPMNKPFVRRYGYFKVSVSSITKENDEKYNLYLGDRKTALHILKMKPGTRKAKILAIKKSKERVNLIRTTKRGNISAYTSFEPEEYTYAKKVC